MPLITVSMPSGVERLSRSEPELDESKLMITISMPSSIEHPVNVVPELSDDAPADHRLDAFGR